MMCIDTLLIRKTTIANVRFGMNILISFKNLLLITMKDIYLTGYNNITPSGFSAPLIFYLQ